MKINWLDCIVLAGILIAVGLGIYRIVGLM